MSSKFPMENNLSSWSMGCNHQRQMFPSNHTYAEQCPFGDETISKNEPTSSFFHFCPSPGHSNRFLSYDHELLSEQFAQFPHPIASAIAITSASAEAKVSAAKEMAVPGSAQNFFPSKNRSSSPIAADRRKRGSNRERHSKIFTAQGLRDRRMRLSVDVAHEFFGLQDMLGFDKASKTVGWLLMKSKAAIKELNRNLSKTRDCGSDIFGGANSTSESEDMSVIDETTVDVDQQENDLKQKSLAGPSMAKRIRGSQNGTFCPVARESRAIARAKARERTRDKLSKRTEKSKQLPKASGHDADQLRPLSPLGSAEESSSRISHDKNSLELGVEINEPKKLELSVFDYHQQISNPQGVNTSNLVSFSTNDMMSFFLENWDMDSPRTCSNGCDIPEQIASLLFNMPSDF